MAPQFNLLEDKSCYYDNSKHIVTRQFKNGLQFMVLHIYGSKTLKYYNLKKITRYWSGEN